MVEGPLITSASRGQGNGAGGRGSHKPRDRTTHTDIWLDAASGSAGPTVASSSVLLRQGLMDGPANPFAPRLVATAGVDGLENRRVDVDRHARPPFVLVERGRASRRR